MVYNKGVKITHARGVCLIHIKGEKNMTNLQQLTTDGQLVRYWDDWSMTTGTHIKSFCGLNKKAFFELPLESL